MNNSIINIINKLEKDYKCKIIRNKKHNLNDDIDIEITINNFKKIKNFLLDNNFCHHYESSSKSHFYTFLNNNFIHLDIIKNKKYINKFFNVSINNIDILNDNTNSKFLRYILLLRKEKLDFFINNKKYIQDNNLLKSKIIQKLFFKDNLDFNDLINIINRKKLIKYLKINNFFSYKIGRIKEIFNVLNSGKIISLLGPDGSGKSTIGDILYKELNGKYIYMGGRGYKLEKIYNKYENIILLKLPIFLMRYFENIIRYISVYKYKLKGYLVFTDRYPKWDVMIGKDSVKTINKILYIVFYKYIYPKPDIAIVLYNTPEEIIKRKKELKKNEINKYFENIKNVLKNNKNTYYMKNDDLDNTLNKILKIIF